ncbi:MAG: DUF1287 domain-containing protein [Cocleimonas sp.]
MLKKLTALTPLLIMSIGMTACSAAKAPKTTSSQAVKPVAKVAPALKTEIKITPVVYEKRSPKPRARRAVVRRPARTTRTTRRSNPFPNKLSNAALGRLRSSVTYNGSYVKIAYPWGDVPANIGVCTDVVIRSYRKLGIDLQQQVHQDMSAAFNSYPNPRKWGLSKPDTNIDHRRVYNLRAFFARRGAGLPITRNPHDYRPGDLVTWMVGPDLPHIGIVVDRPSKADPRRKMIVHNIANGPEMEDILFRFPITGHYRYTPNKMGSIPKAPVYTGRSKSNTDRMNYDQLVAAANRLANVKTPSRSQLQKIDRVDRANGVTNSSNNSLQLATLNNAAIEALLK